MNKGGGMLPAILIPPHRGQYIYKIKAPAESRGESCAASGAREGAQGAGHLLPADRAVGHARRCSSENPAGECRRGLPQPGLEGVSPGRFFRGAERRLDVGELYLRCRVIGWGGAAVSLVPLTAPVAEPPSPSANALPATPTPRAITAARIMVFIGLLLNSVRCCGSEFCSIAGDLPRCDAQEMDLIYRKYNPD